MGNVSPARMDFRWFLVGNCIAILSCLVTREQATAIMDLIEERWEDLIGEMPLKITYPALDLILRTRGGVTTMSGLGQVSVTVTPSIQYHDSFFTGTCFIFQQRYSEVFPVH